MKQHLKIKSFWGYSENAVKTQVYIAIRKYTIFTKIHNKMNIKYSTYGTLQIIRAFLLDKTPVNQLQSKNENQDFKELNHNPLTI